MHMSCKLFFITVGALRQASSKLQESSMYTESKKTTKMKIDIMLHF